MITVEKLSGGYQSTFRLQEVDFHVEKGEFFGIIGPNGSGKTTLVKMMSGVLPYDEGEICLKGKRIDSYRPKELARRLAVLPQMTEMSFSFTVRETVALGRYAHKKGLFTNLTEKDEEIINEVLTYTDMKGYEDVPIDRLSGGERQRVFLAQAMAQEPEVIILDEPTNHLDLSYQKELLDLLQQWTEEKGLTVIGIFHDLNLAALYCERLLLLHKGRVHICDTPNEVLTSQHMLQVYNTAVESQAHPYIPKAQLMLTPRKRKCSSLRITDRKYVHIGETAFVYTSPVPLKTVSNSEAIESQSWYRYFIRPLEVKEERGTKERKSRGLVELEGRKRETALLSSVPAKTLYDYQAFQWEDISVLLIAMLKEEVREERYLDIWLIIDADLNLQDYAQMFIRLTEEAMKIFSNIVPASSSYRIDEILIASSQRGKGFDASYIEEGLKEHLYEMITRLLQNTIKA